MEPWALDPAFELNLSDDVLHGLANILLRVLKSQDENWSLSTNHSGHDLLMIDDTALIYKEEAELIERVMGRTHGKMYD